MNPSNPKYIEEAFEDATNARVRYLVFDLRVRFKTNNIGNFKIKI
jgi:hypothetical protein